MNTKFSSLLAGIALAILASAASAQSADTANAESTAAVEREVFVEQGSRSSDAGTTSLKSSPQALRTQGPRTRTEKGRAAPLAAINQDFWIFEAFVNIFFDEDLDGFFTRVELDFDAETVFTEADVFAVIYLSLEGGPWNEVVETDVFRIFGAGEGDEYFVDIDLLTGYPSGSYDILIELYDTFDGQLVAEFGPNDSLELFDLPLEDQLRDEVIVGGPTVFVSEGGGGALGGAALLALGVLALRRRLRN
ncbi:MAG: choice-of-anchor H family protein [Pseudomonadota bacterium]